MFKKIVYIIFYAGAVTTATWLVDWLVFNSNLSTSYHRIEYALYDHFQKQVLDEGGMGETFRYRIFEPILDDFLLIDLGEDYINKETGRLRKDSLLSLMQLLTKDPEFSALFLDYQFTKNKNVDTRRQDSLLINQFNLIKDQLVLPYLIEYDPISFNQTPIWDSVKSKSEELLFQDCTLGFLGDMRLIG